MSEREQKIQQFLIDQGWGNAQRTPIPGDASSRRYERLRRGDDKAMLMDTPMSVEPKDEYAKAVGLAGNDSQAFVCLAKLLTRRGFSAPQILATDLKDGLILLEDLGDDLFSAVLNRDPDKEELLYSNAVSVLAAIYRSTISPDQNAMGAKWHIGDYDIIALKRETDLFLEWYMPEFEKEIDAKGRDAWHTAWNSVLQCTSHIPPGLVLRDFHADNIFWLSKRAGLDRVGLIDFQDALFNHPAYDLASLIEDVRRIVDPALARPLKALFCKEAGIAYDEGFKAAYAALAAQRNAKILGIFVRLSTRDRKHSYRDLLPRVRTHFLRDIRKQGLEPLQEWVKIYAPNLASTT